MYTPSGPARGSHGLQYPSLSRVHTTNSSPYPQSVWEHCTHAPVVRFTNLSGRRLEDSQGHPKRQSPPAADVKSFGQGDSSADTYQTVPEPKTSLSVNSSEASTSSRSSASNSPSLSFTITISSRVAVWNCQSPLSSANATQPSRRAQNRLGYASPPAP